MQNDEKMQEAVTDAIFDSMKVMAKLDAKYPGTDAIIAANVLVATLKKYENMGPMREMIFSKVYEVLSQVEIKE